MRNLSLLFWDEYRYFCKSRVMIYLWLGIPLIMVTFHLLPKNSNQNPALHSVFMATGTFGMIAGAMLCASIISELNRGVYVLLLVRPLNRHHILIAKYLVVLLSVGLAFIISICLCIAVDYGFSEHARGEAILSDAVLSLCFFFCLLSVTASEGVLFGILARSLNVGMILYIILCMNSQVGVMAFCTYLPKWLNQPPLWLHALVLIGSGGAATLVLMGIAIALFNKRQL